MLSPKYPTLCFVQDNLHSWSSSSTVIFSAGYKYITESGKEESKEESRLSLKNAKQKTIKNLKHSSEGKSYYSESLKGGWVRRERDQGPQAYWRNRVSLKERKVENWEPGPSLHWKWNQCRSSLLCDKGVWGPRDHSPLLGVQLPELKVSSLTWDNCLSSVQTVVKKELFKSER